MIQVSSPRCAMRDADLAFHGFGDLRAEVLLKKAGGAQIAARGGQVDHGGLLCAVAHGQEGVVERCAGGRTPGGLIELASRGERAVDARSTAAAVQPDGVDGVGQRGLCSA
jgi:hypothetical protein